MVQISYRYGTLRTDNSDEARANNDTWVGDQTLGIEVTFDPLAERCKLGNIDPQHGPDGKSSAIEQALEWPLPPNDTRLVTIRHDRDAIGAMAILMLRAEGKEHKIDKLVTNAIGVLDRMPAWRAEKEYGELLALFDRKQFDAMSYIVKHPTWPIVRKVKLVAAVFSGELPQEEIDRYVRLRLEDKESRKARATTRDSPRWTSSSWSVGIMSPASSAEFQQVEVPQSKRLRAFFIGRMRGMRLKSIELSGFKSFAKKTTLEFGSAITGVVGPNGSGKSNIAESFRFVLGEQSMKSMRGRRGEDLIWNGSGAVPRAGRASARLVFDNSDRALNLDFDEVSIERVVHRDGVNDYLLNGSHVRLRDIAELLSQANIGSSGHHIISQGEADRVLSASSRERREMLEDALGLTAYLYKREEAERKLQRADENMREVAAVRRELAPHLKFLGSQVKKIEQAQALREDLAEKYTDYLQRERMYLSLMRAQLGAEKEAPAREHKNLGERIDHLRQALSKKRDDAGSQELVRLEEEGRTVAKKQEAANRELGAVEGELRAHAALAKEQGGTVPAGEARAFAERVLSELEGKGNIAALIVLAKEFLRRLSTSAPAGRTTEELGHKKTELEKELAHLRTQEEKTRASVEKLRRELENQKDLSRDAERELFAAMARRSELESTLNSLRSREELLRRDDEQYQAEFREASVLLSRIPEVETDVVFEDEPRSAQEERRRKIERLKIRLEEAGLGNSSEVLKEHQETSERDAFLARELADLEQSAAKLRELIDELTKTLETRFVDGIDKINKEFENFFKLMFGGGSASLAIVKEKKLKRGASEAHEGDDEAVQDEDVEIEEGVDITIALPHKRIKGLHMLSGGERALTSIALIFAMSQVNPPPFLILDETDAALDEANSRRYGDMIESLSRASQLILITHNRETMSRAGILYGVTMGQDGVSKLLSVKFEEALAVAK